ncbi:uncharacterized protein LOC135212878 [Macrobrachium nipponense]|uniref:uncharacterized protein LOC135212878 n=1 Tax=Macrobrachium nipponense TaxID=159736 RepID=UPI0030C80FAB
MVKISVIFAIFLSTAFVTGGDGPPRSLLRYIKGWKFNFFMVPGKALQRSKSQHILTTNVTNCTCKTACVAVGCKAWSITPRNDGTKECRLDTDSRAGPMDTTPEDIPDSVYFFREDSIPGNYSQPEDGLLYVHLRGRNDYASGKSCCSRIPGHRLIILKTLRQRDYAMNLASQFQEKAVMMDLRKNLTTSPTSYFWGDGTQFLDTEVKQVPILGLSTSQATWRSVYVLEDSQLKERYPTTEARIICQANPFGVDW